MAKYPYTRVSGKVKITPVNDAPLSRMERLNFGIQQVWRNASTPTLGTKSPARSGPASRLVSGSKVAGATQLKGGQV